LGELTLSAARLPSAMTTITLEELCDFVALTNQQLAQQIAVQQQQLNESNRLIAAFSPAVSPAASPDAESPSVISSSELTDDDEAWVDDEDAEDDASDDASHSSTFGIMDHNAASSSSCHIDDASAISCYSMHDDDTSDEDDDASEDEDDVALDDASASSSFSIIDDAASNDASPSTTSPSSWDYPMKQWVEFAANAATLCTKDGIPPGTSGIFVDVEDYDDEEHGDGHDHATGQVLSCLPRVLFDDNIKDSYCAAKLYALTARSIPAAGTALSGATRPHSCRWALTLLDFARMELEELPPSPTTITLQSLIDTVGRELDRHLFASLHILREDAEWTTARSLGNAPSFGTDAIEDPAGNEEGDGAPSNVDIAHTNKAATVFGTSDATRPATPHHSTNWGEDNAAMTAPNNNHAGRSPHRNIAPPPVAPMGAITRSRYRAITRIQSWYRQTTIRMSLAATHRLTQPAAPTLSHRPQLPSPTTVTVESTSIHIPSAVCEDSLLWKSRFNNHSLGVLAIMLNLLLEGHHPTSHRRWRLLPPTPSDQPPTWTTLLGCGDCHPDSPWTTILGYGDCHPD